MLRTFTAALLAVAMCVGFAQAKGTSTRSRVASWANKRLQHVSVVSHLPIKQCCARRGNRVMGKWLPARRKECADNLSHA